LQNRLFFRDNYLAENSSFKSARERILLVMGKRCKSTQATSSLNDFELPDIEKSFSVQD